MTNNNILTPNSEYWKDNAIETFKGNSDLFIDFLQERDRHSAWIETQITDVQFEAMFAEPMYIADDAKKYSIPAEIVQEAANNSKLYGVVRGKHIPVGLAATESLIGYSKLIREGYSWMRRVNPVNLAKAINNGIDTIRYDDRRSTKCLVKVGDEMIRSVVSARYAPMPSGDLFNYINMDYLPENWEKAQFMSGYWTHERVRGKNGRVNGMYDVAVSGNGKDVMAQVASSREVTTDANGNKLIKDDKLGTFAYNKETGTFEQVKDKDGNAPENPLSVQVPDKVNKNNVEEVADWATKTDGFDKAVQEKEATDNYFNATAAERLDMNPNDVNQDQMNNMARHEINDAFEREGANGEKQLAIGEDDKLDVAVDKDTGEMTAKHSMLNDDGTVSVQNYKKDTDGNWQAVGESEYYTAMGDKPSYRNDKGEVFVGTQVGTSNDGNAIMRYDQIGENGKLLENGKSFNVTQSASLANSDDAASKVEMARQASESLGAKAVAADYENAKNIFNGNGTNIPEDTNFNKPEIMYAASQEFNGAATSNPEFGYITNMPAVEASSNGAKDGIYTQTFTDEDGFRATAKLDMDSKKILGVTTSTAKAKKDGSVEVEKITTDANENVTGEHYRAVPQRNPLDTSGKDDTVIVDDILSGQQYSIKVPKEITNNEEAFKNYMNSDEGASAIEAAKRDTATLRDAVVNSQSTPIPDGTKIDPAAARSLAYEAIANGNCDNADITAALQEGTLQIVANDTTVDGKPCLGLVYPSRATGVRTETECCLEPKDGDVGVTTVSAPRAVQTEAQVRDAVKEMTESIMMAPASDAEASEDFYKQKQFADDSFHGPNRLDYTGKVGARQMAEAAHAEMGDYEPFSCDIVDGGEGVIVGRKDTSVPDSLTAMEKGQVIRSEEYILQRGGNGKEMSEAGKVSVLHKVNGALSIGLPDGSTAEIFDMNPKTGEIKLRTKNVDDDGFGEITTVNLGKGKATSGNVVKTLMENLGKSPESRNMKALLTGEDEDEPTPPEKSTTKKALKKTNIGVQGVQTR